MAASVEPALPAVGGIHYGSVLTPKSLGSQGGDGNGGPGAPGGGAIRLVVGGRLTVDGRLTADGLNTSVDNFGRRVRWQYLAHRRNVGRQRSDFRQRRSRRMGGWWRWWRRSHGLLFQRDEFAGAISAIGGGGVNAVVLVPFIAAEPTTPWDRSSSPTRRATRT